MEKYGVDMSNLPATDDQIREIRKLANEKNCDFQMPKNRDDADKIIEKLANSEEGGIDSEREGF